MAAGTMSIIGLIPIETDVIAMSGIMIEAIAVLETTSLRKVIKRTIRKNNHHRAEVRREEDKSTGNESRQDRL